MAPQYHIDIILYKFLA